MIGWKPKSQELNVASVRYRCLIPLKIMNKKGIQIEIFNEAQIDKYSKVIFSKCYSETDQELARIIKNQGGKVMLDICDNHFYNPYGLEQYVRARKNLSTMISLSDVLICSTLRLAEEIKVQNPVKAFPKVITDPVEDLPSLSILTSDRMQLAWELRRLPSTNEKRFLWFGSHGSPNAPGGMEDILQIRGLLEATNSISNIELWVVSNNVDKYNKLIKPINVKTRYFDWDYRMFKLILQSVDAVVIPINRNPFTLCKTHNRLSLALYNMVPVIADSIPSYQEFSDYSFLDDWNAGIEAVVKNKSELVSKTRAGLLYLSEYYNPEVISKEWEKALVSN